MPGLGPSQAEHLSKADLLVFFNDLPSELENEGDNYADDTTITATAKTVSEIGNKLTSDCSKVSDWMHSNKLKLNPDKTHIMTIGTSERLRILPNTVQVTMDNIILEEDVQKCELLLGCHIQSYLKWSKQIKLFLKNCRRELLGS